MLREGERQLRGSVARMGDRHPAEGQHPQAGRLLALVLEDGRVGKRVYGALENMEHAVVSDALQGEREAACRIWEPRP